MCKKLIGFCLVMIALGLGYKIFHQKKDFDSHKKVLKVGVTAGPHAIIMEKVKEEAKQQGLSIEIIEFNDFILPNEALNHGDIDINSYQHLPFMEEQIATRGYKLKSLGKTILMPMGIYSKSIKTLDAIPYGAIISIPNDPTNEERALLFLESLGLIKLNKTSIPTIQDIVENPKNIQIKELEAPALVMTLSDVTASVINTDWIILGGLSPKDALSMESSDSSYANIIVIREEENNKDIKEFLKIYQSDAMKTFIHETFKGAVIPIW